MLTVLPYHSSMALDAWQSPEGIFAKIPKTPWDICKHRLYTSYTS
jgi:hypothetical protein